MVNFVLKVLSEMGTLTTASATLCKPDLETLAVIHDNQLSREIQFKSIRSLGAEPPVWSVVGKASHEQGAKLP